MAPRDYCYGMSVHFQPPLPTSTCSAATLSVVYAALGGFARLGTIVYTCDHGVWLVSGDGTVSTFVDGPKSIPASTAWIRR